MQREVANVSELVDVCARLNEANLFAVLVFARFKQVRQMAEQVKPYVQERRSGLRVVYPQAHFVGRAA